MSGDMYTCHYCTLKDKNVECGGMFHCPNDLCTGPGAAYFRSTLQSFEEEGEKHTVNEIEWLWRGRDNMKEKKPHIWEWAKSSGYYQKFVKGMENE